MIAADSEADYLICWFIINKPQPNLYSGDAFLSP